MTTGEAARLLTPTAEALRELEQALSGPVFVPGQQGYDDECATYNSLVAPRPVLAVGAASVDDVQLAVRFAGQHGLAVTVLGDGHMMVGPMEEALLITLHRMGALRVDEESGTARVLGHVPWQSVVDAAAQIGLAPMNGSSPRVGVIGYLLGGGQSPTLGRTHGYASDHVLALEVVTADGELRHVTGESDPDLFFALRGGKGNFGVVTGAEFRLFPVTKIFGGGLYFPGEQMAQVLRTWRDWMHRMPEQMTSSVAIQRLPELPELPLPLRGAFVVHVRIAFLGDPWRGAELIEPLRAIGPRVLDTVAEIAYKEAGTINADPPEPMPYVDLGAGLRELSDGVLEVFDEYVGPKSQCPLASVEIRALGGALALEPEFPDAIPSRGIPFQAFAFGVGPEEGARVLRAYLERWVDALQPWADDHSMVNFLSPDEAHTEAEVRRVYGAERYERLSLIKARYDPANTFRVNHNIRPAHGEPAQA